MLICLSPELAADQPVQFEVSNYGSVHRTVESFRYVVRLMARIDRLEPSSGAARGASLITVHGSNFLDTDRLACRFGSSKVSLGSWLSSSKVSCVVPSGFISNVTVELSNNGVDFTENGAQFLYVRIPQLLKILPSKGLTLGGLLVTVSGKGLDSEANASWICKFCSIQTIATQSGSSGVLCITPSHHAGLCIVEVSADSARHFSEDGLHFEYRSGAAVLGLSPSLGPASGGTLVVVHGFGFVGTAFTCRFGQSLAAAEQLSTTTLRCISARNVEGSTSVEVQVDDLAFTDDGHQFIHHGEVELLSVAPAVISVSSGQLLTIIGRHFDRINAACRIGGAQSLYAVWHSSTRIFCTTPELPEGTLSIEVSNNGVDYTRSNAVVSTKLVLTIFSLAPSIGPQTGNTQIHIVCSRVPARMTLSCHFGSLLVAAVQVSETTIVCTTPPSEAATVRLKVAMIPDLAASSMSRIFSTDIDFMYVAPPVVTQISPSRGPTDGGSIVRVNGLHMVAGHTFCRFGAAAAVLAVAFLSSSEVSCASPAHKQGLVRVDIGMNAIEFSASSFSFLFEERPIVMSLVPDRGFERQAILVSVHGRNFAAFDELACRIGAEQAHPAVWRSSSRLVCSLPQLKRGKFSVEITNDGIHFSNSRQKFEAFEKPLAIRIQPTVGLLSQSRLVTVFGRAFETSQKILCRFGDLSSVAAFRSRSEVECRSPVGHSTGIVPVQILVEEIQVSEDMAFEYLDDIRFLAIQPAAGPATGGTLVRIVGSGLASVKSLCRFGDVQADSHTSIFSDTMLQCFSPPANNVLEASSVSVTLVG